ETLDALTRDQQGLVDVVVQDRPRGFQVETVERHRDRLDERVADRVGMAESFPLHELDAPCRDRDLAQRLDHEGHDAARSATQPSTPMSGTNATGSRSSRS